MGREIWWNVKRKTNRPRGIKCWTCAAPGIDKSTRFEAKVERVDLLTPLKDLVRCIRAGQLGDFSPLMDEIFDAEHAIRMAENKAKKGLDYE